VTRFRTEFGSRRLMAEMAMVPLAFLVVLVVGVLL
jgi:hypothetical protein